jgi:nuclear pore complex protein Nup93
MQEERMFPFITMHNGLSDILFSNYLLAQARVDASALSNSIAHLNTSTTFSPLQPLQDTDVAGYLRHAHEQNLISTIEEGRKETQADFYRVLEERSRKDWEAKKRRVFEELGGHVSGDGRAVIDLKKSLLNKSSLSVSIGFFFPLRPFTFFVVRPNTNSDSADAGKNDGI